MADIDALTAIIEPEAKALGFDLVRVMWGGGILQVMAERPETRQLGIDDCAALSRRISDKFDELDPIPEAYRLEVSSPGIDRPLTRLRDFADWSGHEAKITLKDRKTFKATLDRIEGETIFLAYCDRLSVHFADIASAKLVLTDRLIAATQPLSAEGADDIQLEGQD